MNLSSAFLKGLQGKIRAKLTGQAPVARSCQIPDIRSVLMRAGLKVNSGTFVEIGAYDGDTFSNTSFLADQGWRGLYVEPVPKYYRRACLRHYLNDVRIENVAIGRARGEIRFGVKGSVSRALPANSTADENGATCDEDSTFKKTISVKTDTLENVLSRNGIPHVFDLMVIDVEGFEDLVLSDLLASPWWPRALIVELVDNCESDDIAPDHAESHRLVRRAILEGGYEEFLNTGINTIFLRP